MIDRAVRELERERLSLQNQEKKTVAEIKKMAKEGQMVRVDGQMVVASFLSSSWRSMRVPALSNLDTFGLLPFRPFLVFRRMLSG
jgi:hypothetical protein